MKPLTITVFGVTLPIPRWSVGAFGIIAIVAAGNLVYKEIVPPPPAELVTLKEANASLAFAVQEYGLHLNDVPVQSVRDEDGDMSISVYKDHCVLIQRRSLVHGTQTRLIPDPSRDIPKDIALAEMTHVDVLPVVEAAGQCLNPHPGYFDTKSERVAECAVRVYRIFQDGCVHFQMFNPCNGAWDTNYDGSPHVTWVSCVH